MAQKVDIDIDETGPLVWQLADEKGPVDLTGATVERRIIGPRPSGAVLITDDLIEVVGPGRVSMDREPLVEGWLGFIFTAAWGGTTKQFPSTGPRWMLVGQR